MDINNLTKEEFQDYLKNLIEYRVPVIKLREAITEEEFFEHCRLREEHKKAIDDAIIRIQAEERDKKINDILNGE